MTIEEKLGRAKYDLEYMHTIGYEKGQSEGYTEGLDHGRDAEWRDFWRVFQENGERRDYVNAFGLGWNDATFRPRFDIVVTKATEMFKESKIVDISECLNRCGVTLDTSKATRMEYAFCSTDIRRIPEISFEGITQAQNTSGVFGWMQAHTIDCIVLKEDGSTPIQSDWFIATSSLVNVSFKGTIGVSISFQDSTMLSEESMKNVIAHLADYSGTDKANAYKLTFAESCWARLEESGTAHDGGTWREYVASLGWNT